MICIDPYAWDVPTDIISNSIPGGVASRNGMFALDTSEMSFNPESIVVEVRPALTWDSVALFNVSADTVEVELFNGPSAYSVVKSLAYGTPVSPEFLNTPRFVLLDLPEIDPATYPTAYLRVEFTATGRVAHCSNLLVGTRVPLGLTLYETTLEIVDYSRKERDVFGNILLVERGYTDKVTYLVDFDTPDVDQIKTYLASRRAQFTIYVGSINVPETIVLGVYDDFGIPLESFSSSRSSLTVESIVQDKPEYASDIQAVFADLDVATCDYFGTTKDILLVSGLPQDTATVTLNDRPLGPGETAQWYYKVYYGVNQNSSSQGTVTTPCGDMTYWGWPGGVPALQEDMQIAIYCKLEVDTGIFVKSSEAILTVRVDPEFAQCDCVPDPLDPGWRDGQSDSWSIVSEVGLGQQDKIMVEVPSSTQVPISGTAGSKEYYWIEIPSDFASCRVQLALFSGSATAYVLLAVNDCTIKLPTVDTLDSGTDVTVYAAWADRNKFDACLVLVVGDSTYSGTIERTITLQLPT